METQGTTTSNVEEESSSSSGGIRDSMGSMTSTQSRCATSPNLLYLKTVAHCSPNMRRGRGVLALCLVLLFAGERRVRSRHADASVDTATQASPCSQREAATLAGARGREHRRCPDVCWRV